MEQESQSNPTETDAIVQKSDFMMKRYRNAYSIASSLLALGALNKLLGWFGGIAIWGVAFIYGQEMGDTQLLPSEWRVGLVLFAGFSWLAVFQLAGAIFSGLAQLIQASIDSAVFVCPFLSAEQKRETVR